MKCNYQLSIILIYTLLSKELKENKKNNERNKQY